MKNNKTPQFWLKIALLLCVISMLGASFVQTQGGSVTGVYGSYISKPQRHSAIFRTTNCIRRENNPRWPRPNL